MPRLESRTLVNPQRRRNPAQRRRGPAGETFEDVAAAGQRCIDKIEQVEEIEYDELVRKLLPIAITDTGPCL